MLRIFSRFLDWVRFLSDLELRRLKSSSEAYSQAKILNTICFATIPAETMPPTKGPLQSEKKTMSSFIESQWTDEEKNLTAIILKRTGHVFNITSSRAGDCFKIRVYTRRRLLLFLAVEDPFLRDSSII